MAIPSVARRRFSAEEYQRLMTSGVLSEDDRVELIEGEIIEMPPIDPPHASAVSRLITILASRADERFVLWSQSTLWLSERSMPEPDVLLLRYRDDHYRARHPTPDDVLLLVEVSVSSADYDRTVKLPLYAKRRIPEVWLVLPEPGRIEVYRQPEDDRYSEHVTAARGQAIAPTALPDVSVDVTDIVGPSPAPT